MLLIKGLFGGHAMLALTNKLWRFLPPQLATTSTVNHHRILVKKINIFIISDLVGCINFCQPNTFGAMLYTGGTKLFMIKTSFI